MANSQFMADINAFIDKAKANQEELIRVIGIKILARLVDMSPVGNPDLWHGSAPEGYTGGRFRGNWQVSFDQPIDGETDRIDKAGSATKEVGNLALSQFRAGMKEVYFVNNVPYAYRLEFGHSSQAPGGMVRVTAESFQKFFSDAVREVKT